MVTAALPEQEELWSYLTSARGTADEEAPPISANTDPDFLRT